MILSDEVDELSEVERRYPNGCSVNSLSGVSRAPVAKSGDEGLGGSSINFYEFPPLLDPVKQNELVSRSIDG